MTTTVMKSHPETALLSAASPGAAAPAQTIQSLEMVRSLRWWRWLALVLVALITLATAGLIFVPWQQSVSGAGRVTVFSPQDRPQTVEAQIPGRIAEWNVADG